MSSRIRRFSVVGIVALALGGGWTACVGDDTASGSSGPQRGDRLGPCFADGKCKEGLVCRDGEICLTPDEPKPSNDGGGDVADSATPSDAAPGDAGADGATCTPYVPPAPSSGAYCPPGTCGSNPEGCCLLSGNSWMCGTKGAACPQAAPFWGCETQAQCGNARCCLLSDGPPTAGTTCTAHSTNGRTSCVDPNQCVPLGGRETCNTNADCPTQNCRAEEVSTALGFSIVIKVCAN